MEDKFITIKTIELINNCPECFNTTGLELTFKQRFVETKFYKKITKETTHLLECRTCNTIIYPISWTEDIERVFNYHQRAIIPKAVSFKLKKLAWVTIISVLFLLIVLIGVIIIISNL